MGGNNKDAVEALQERFERLNGHEIQTGCGLVSQDDVGLPEVQAQHGKPLLLATAQLANPRAPPRPLKAEVTQEARRLIPIRLSPMAFHLPVR